MSEQLMQPMEGELTPKQKTLMENPIKLGGDITVFGSSEGFVLGQRMAQALSCSTFVPESYQARLYDKDGNFLRENYAAVGNCLMALELSSRLDVSPLMIMQNVDMVKGRPGFRGAFCASLINSSYKFPKGDLDYEIEGDPCKPGYRCRAFATRRDGKVVHGEWITWEMVTGESWDKNPKWKTMPGQMMRYRSAAFFIKAYAPERMLGLPTMEELEDMTAAAAPTRSLEALNERLDRHASQDDAQGQEVTQTATSSPASADPNAALESTKPKQQPRNKPVDPLPQKEEGATGTQPAEAQSAAAPSPTPAAASPTASLATDFNLE